MGVAPSSAQTLNEIVLHSFAISPRGAQPCTDLTRDAAGNFYGSTQYGGAGNVGAVYKFDTAGHLTVLYSFSGGINGLVGPCSSLTLDATGNVYGTTPFGGTANVGMVYRLDTAGHLTTLYSFTGGSDGGTPEAGVTFDPIGNLYGTTYSGGVANKGVVYKLDAAGRETVLYSFRGGSNDGSGQKSGVIRDPAGNLYGTTESGGTFGAGTVYLLDTAGHETVLHSFAGADDGCYPTAGLTRDSSGNLYGTANCGIDNDGVVYEVNSAGQETVLYTFTGRDDTDARNPKGGLIRDSAGNLYGTVYRGGKFRAGLVYKLDASGQETVLYNFGSGAQDGRSPAAGMIIDSAGDLYGTTQLGGTTGEGVLYKLDAGGQETVLYSLGGGGGGALPDAGVIRDSAGNLYGTTNAGGANNGGVVYKLDSAGQETVLYSFLGGTERANPFAGVIGDSDGNLYGTTYYGGPANMGTVYKLDAAGKETVLHTFAGGTDGGYPLAGLIRDSAGNLYGTTSEGTVYKLDASGNFSVLYGFTSGADGGRPYAGVILDSAGNLYGTTYDGGVGEWGTVFRLDTSGNLTALYSFTGADDGGLPEAGVIRDSAGNLYGTTTYGGTANAGVVYKLDPAGNETVLYSFTCADDGCAPTAGVIMDPAGNLYGTTLFGGRYGNGHNGSGVVFKLELH